MIVAGLPVLMLRIVVFFFVFFLIAIATLIYLGILYGIAVSRQFSCRWIISVHELQNESLVCSCSDDAPFSRVSHVTSRIELDACGRIQQGVFALQQRWFKTSSLNRPPARARVHTECVFQCRCSAVGQMGVAPSGRWTTRQC